MKRLLALIKEHQVVIIAAVVYAIGCLALLPWYRHVINPDGISYLSIAQKYGSGNFSEAINGYWGPLLSWLLAPFSYINRDLQVAAKLVVMLGGLGVIVVSYTLIKRWKLEKIPTLLFFIVLIPLLLLWTMTIGITPDMFILLFFLLYVLLLTSKRTHKSAVLLGLIGALGYYGKAYFLPFFLVHITVVYGYDYLKVDKKNSKNILRNQWLLIVATTLVLCAPWFILLSHKYGKPTYSTSAGYNLSILNPTKPGHPMKYLGLLQPPNHTALSSWEDPSFTPQASWSPLSSRSNLAGFIRILLDNGKRAGAALLEFSVLTIASVFMLVVYAAHKGRKLDRRIGLIGSALVIYVGGYVLINAEYRYFWPMITGLLLIGLLLHKEKQLPRLHTAAARLATGLAIVSIIITPLTQLYYRHNLHVPTYYQAQQFMPYVHAGDRVASDSFDSIQYCYYLDAICYGALNESLGDEFNSRQLAKYDIEKVIILDADTSWQKPAYLEGFTKVETGTAVQLFVRSKLNL